MLPLIIRMSKLHHLAGRILRLYTGKPYTINLGGGLTCTVNTGDYIGFECSMNPEWLLLNSHMWEPVEPLKMSA